MAHRIHGLRVGDTVKTSYGEKLQIEKLDFSDDGTPFKLSDGLWYSLSELSLEVPMPENEYDQLPKIQDAWIVEGITFHTREEAVDHVIGIALHNELKKVFDGALKTAGQEAILETLVLKLIKDKETFKEILNARP